MNAEDPHMTSDVRHPDGITIEPGSIIVNAVHRIAGDPATGIAVYEIDCRSKYPDATSGTRVSMSEHGYEARTCVCLHKNEHTLRCDDTMPEWKDTEVTFPFTQEGWMTMVDIGRYSVFVTVFKPTWVRDQGRDHDVTKFSNLYDRSVFAAQIPATWDAADDQAIVSYWTTDPPGIGLAADDGDGITSVGLTASEARNLADLLIEAAAKTEP